MIPMIGVLRKQNSASEAVDAVAVTTIAEPAARAPFAPAVNAAALAAIADSRALFVPLLDRLAEQLAAAADTSEQIKALDRATAGDHSGLHFAPCTRPSEFQHVTDFSGWLERTASLRTNSEIR